MCLLLSVSPGSWGFFQAPNQEGPPAGGTASSQRQVKAIADNVEDELTKLGIEARGKEGYDSQVWVLLDYGDVMVHIFNEENRDFYNLEKLWKDAPYVDVDNLA